MALVVVWVAQEQARIFQISDVRMQRESLQSVPEKGGLGGMFKELALMIGTPRRILILGPDLAKEQFLAHLKESQPGLATRVVGCEHAELLTDPQVAAFAIRYLQPNASSKVD